MYKNIDTIITVSLTINTLFTFMSERFNRLSRRWYVYLYDYNNWAKKSIDFFKKFIAPILLRCMVFEILFSLYYLLTENHYIQEKIFSSALCSCLVLFFPQLIYILFCIYIDVLIFSVLCAKHSFQNNRPYWVAIIEFIFECIFFGVLKLILPTIFVVVAQNAFYAEQQKLKDNQQIIMDDIELADDITIDLAKLEQVQKTVWSYEI